MAAEVQNIEFHSGDTKYLDVSILDDDDVAVDVTGAGVTYVIAGSEIVVTKTEADGITIATSVVTVALDPADTEALAGEYFQEMQIVDGAGDVTTVLVGRVGIAKDLIV